jgi:hypothetical protein
MEVCGKLHDLAGLTPSNFPPPPPVPKNLVGGFVGTGVNLDALGRMMG